ncbi:MAG: TolB family protein [Anaerolineae bacterium]
MFYLRRWIFPLGCLVALFSVWQTIPVFAQISVSPNPAQPGQVVTISNTSPDPSYVLQGCQIDGQGSYGNIASGQSVTFTIPSGAQPGSSYVFRCQQYISSSNEFGGAVDPVTIQVVAPPPTDSDSDGIVDGQDQCPNQPGPASNNGCPEAAQPNPPDAGTVDSDGDGVPNNVDTCPSTFGIPEWDGCPDTDGDGLTTQYDNCPNEPGPRETLGCPIDAPAPEPQPTPVPAISLPPLPDNNDCYVATAGSAVVNVRESAGTDAAIIWELSPTQVYQASGTVLDEQGRIWFELENGGFVAGFVIRTSAPCDTLGLTEGGSVQLASYSADWETILTDCPELITYIESLPFPILLTLLDLADNPPPNACDFLTEVIESVVFDGTLFDDVPSDTLEVIFDSCSNRWSQYAAHLAFLRRFDPLQYTALMGELQTYCDSVDDEDDNTVYWTLLNLDRIGLQGLQVALFEECGVNILANEDETGFASLIDSEAVEHIDDLCGQMEMLALLGDMTVTDREFASQMATCSPPITGDLDLLMRVFYTLRVNNIDPSNVFIDDTFCADPIGVLLNLAPHPSVVGRDPSIPSALAACPDLAALLEANNATLDPYTLLAILQTEDPCSAAAAYIYSGVVPAYTGPGLSCAAASPDSIYQTTTTELPENPQQAQSADTPRDDGQCSRTGDRILRAFTGGTMSCRGSRPAVIHIRQGNDDSNAEDEGETSTNYVRVGASGAGVAVRADGTETQISAVSSPLVLVTADGRIIDIRSSWEDKVAAIDRAVGAICESPPPAIANPAPEERVCYGVTWIFQEASAETSVPLKPSVGLALVSEFTDGRPTVYETNVQRVDVPASGIVDLSFAAYVTERFSDPAARTNVALFSFRMDQVTNILGLEFGQVDDALCQNNTVPRSEDYFLSPSLPVRSVANTTLNTAPVDETDTETDTDDAETDSDSSLPPRPEGEAGDLPERDEDATILPPMYEPPADADMPLPADFDSATMLSMPSSDRYSGTNASGVPVVASGANQSTSEIIAGLNPIFAGELGGASAVFQFTSSTSNSDLYVLQEAQVVPLFDATPDDELLPAIDATGTFIAYLNRAPDETESLRVYNLETGESQTLYDSTESLMLLPIQPAWLPGFGGRLLFVTLEDAFGVPGIYAIDLTAEDPVPEVVERNAYQISFSRDGGLMSFTRDVDGIPNIFTRSMRTERQTAITDQTAGTGCQSPAFDTSPLTMYFTCDGELYRYTIGGIEPVQTLGQRVAHPAAAPIASMFAYEDGNTIYLGATDGSAAAPLIQFPNGSVSSVSWATN